MNFIKNLPISRKLLLGFGTMLALILILGIVSFMGFSNYREIARDNVLMGRVQANLLEARIAVKEYLQTKDDDALKEFRERFDMLDGFMDEAQESIENPERAAIVEEMVGDLTFYDDTFAQIGELMDERDRLVALQDRDGLTLRQRLTEIMSSAFDDGDASGAYYAGRAQEHVVLGRLYAMKYLNTNAQEDYNRALMEMSGEADPLFSTLDQELQNPERRRMLAEATSAKNAYTARLSEVYMTITERNKLIEEALDVRGAEVGNDAETVKLSILAEQDRIGPMVNTMIVVMVLLATAVAIAVTLIITRAIKQPVDELVSLADAMVKGDLSHKSTIDQKDEMGVLADAFGAIQVKIQDLLKGTNQLIGSVSDGKLDVRASNSGFEGAYKELVDGVNGLCDAFVQPINVTAEYVDRIAKGDIPPKITDAYKGDFNEIKNNLNQAIDVMNGLTNQINTLIGAASNGKLDVRAESSGFTGGWQTLVNGLNDLVNAFVQPINVTAEYVDRIAKGDIPPRITDAYKGDFNEIKNNLNQAIDVMNGLTTQTNVLIKAASDGKLDVRAESSGFTGGWQTLVNGLNDLVNAFVHPINVTAEYVDRIAKGDIPPKITEAYKGDFNEIKNNLNQAIDVMNGLLSAVGKVIEAARAGQLDERAESGSFTGGWQQLVKGINEVLEAFAIPLDEAGQVVDVMSTGDLTARMRGNYQGDFKRFEDNINALGQSLEGLINQVNQAVGQTAASAQNITATAENLSVSSREQTSQSNQIATAVEDMSRTITENAMNASKTAEVAENSGQIANSGGAVLQQTIRKMRDISDVVSESAGSIGKLGDSSKQIGDIISVIDDIAYQTNLLALNAAIEAARAGEQGRGFAVVADEVRKLAERTGEATKQIAEMIKKIQSETKDAVGAMDRGTTEVHEGIELADKAGASLQEILESIQSVRDRIGQIAQASEEQSATSEEISASVTSISQVAQDTTQQVDGVSQVAQEMAGLTQELSQLMSRFKTSGA